MKFIIRDDDLNYFNQPADVERWYKDVFAKGIPVGFSTIPFVKSISDVYPHNLPPEDREYPISENRKLTTYVKSNPLVEIMQHGCTHETKNGVFEYRKKVGLFKDTKRGKEELERAFDKTVNVFVPPHDAIYNHGIHAVEQAGMNIIRGIGFKNFIPRSEYVLAFIKMVLHRVLRLRKSALPAYPYVIDLGGHKEAYAFRLADDNLDLLKKGLLYVSKKKGNFIITNHLHNCTEKRKQNLLELIRMGKELGAEFVYPHQLFE